MRTGALIKTFSGYAEASACLAPFQASMHEQSYCLDESPEDPGREGR